MANPVRHQISYDEFDYQVLLDALSDYKHPRDRITKLLRQGTIIRVKKGLYVFGDQDRKGPIHKEILANLIYGPSYVSREYALQYHGVIPERVEVVTSVTTNRSRDFPTPVGRFNYKSIPVLAFRSGVERVEYDQGRFYLQAIPEKALVDKLWADRVSLPSQKSIRSYLFEDLRIEPEVLGTMKVDNFEDYARRYNSRKIRLLASVVRRLKKNPGGSESA